MTTFAIAAVAAPCGSTAVATPEAAAACPCGAVSSAAPCCGGVATALAAACCCDAAAAAADCCCCAMTSLECLSAAAARPSRPLPLSELLLHLRIVASSLEGAPARQRSLERTEEEQGETTKKTTGRDGPLPCKDSRAGVVDLVSERHFNLFFPSSSPDSPSLPPCTSTSSGDTSVSLSTSPPSSSPVLAASSPAASVSSLPGGFAAAGTAAAFTCTADSSAAVAVPQTAVPGTSAHPAAAASPATAVAPGAAGVPVAASTSLCLFSSPVAPTSLAASAADSSAGDASTPSAPPASLTAASVAAAAASRAAPASGARHCREVAASPSPSPSSASPSRPVAPSLPFRPPFCEDLSSPSYTHATAAALGDRLRQLLLSSRFRAAVEQQIARAPAAARRAFCSSRRKAPPQRHVTRTRTEESQPTGGELHAQQPPPGEEKKKGELQGATAAGEAEEEGGRSRNDVVGPRVEARKRPDASQVDDDAAEGKLFFEASPGEKEKAVFFGKSDGPAAISCEDDEAVAKKERGRNSNHTLPSARKHTKTLRGGGVQQQPSAAGTFSSCKVMKDDVRLEWCRLLLLVVKREAPHASISAFSSSSVSSSISPSSSPEFSASSVSSAPRSRFSVQSSAARFSSSEGPRSPFPVYRHSRQAASPAAAAASRPAGGGAAASASAKQRAQHEAAGEETGEVEKEENFVGRVKEDAAEESKKGEELVEEDTGEETRGEETRQDSSKKAVAPPSSLGFHIEEEKKEEVAAFNLLDLLDAILGTLEDVSVSFSREENFFICCRLLADVLFTVDQLRSRSTPASSSLPFFSASSSAVSSSSPSSYSSSSTSSSSVSAAVAVREGSEEGEGRGRQQPLQDFLDRLKNSRRRTLLLLCFLHLPSLACCLSRLLVAAARPPAAASDAASLPTPHFFAAPQHPRDVQQQEQQKKKNGGGVRDTRSSGYEQQLLRRMQQLQRLFCALAPFPLDSRTNSKRKISSDESNSSSSCSKENSKTGVNCSSSGRRGAVQREKDDKEKRGRRSSRGAEEENEEKKADREEEGNQGEATMKREGKRKESLSRGAGGGADKEDERKENPLVGEGFDDEEATRLEELLLLTACTPRGMTWREVGRSTKEKVLSPRFVQLPTVAYTLAFSSSSLVGSFGRLQQRQQPAPGVHCSNSSNNTSRAAAATTAEHYDEAEEEEEEEERQAGDCYYRCREVGEGGTAAPEESLPRRIARAASSFLLQAEAIIAAAAEEASVAAVPATWDQRFAALLVWRSPSVQQVASALLKTIRAITCEDEEQQAQQEDEYVRGNGGQTAAKKGEEDGGEEKRKGDRPRPSLLLLQQHPGMPWRLHLQILNDFFSKCLTCARLPLSMKNSPTPAGTTTAAAATAAEPPLLSAACAARVAAQQFDVSPDVFRDPLTGRFALPGGLPHESAALQLEAVQGQSRGVAVSSALISAPRGPSFSSSSSLCRAEYLLKRGKDENVLGGLPLDDSTTTWLSCCVAQALATFLTRVHRGRLQETEEEGVGFFAIPLILRLVDMPLSPVRHYGWRCLATAAAHLSREEVDIFRGALLQALRDGAPVFKEVSTCLAPYIHAFASTYARIFSDPTESDFLRGTRQLVNTVLLQDDFEYSLFPCVLLHMRQLLNQGGIALTYLLKDFVRLAFRGMESRNPSAALEGLRICKVVFKHFRSAAVCYVNDVLSRLTMLYLTYVSPGYAALVINGEPLPWDPELAENSNDKQKIEADRKEMAEEILCVVSSMRTTCPRSQLFPLLSLLSCSCRKRTSQAHDSTLCKYVQEFRHLCYKRLTASSNSSDSTFTAELWGALTA